MVPVIEKIVFILLRQYEASIFHISFTRTELQNFPHFCYRIRNIFPQFAIFKIFVCARTQQTRYSSMRHLYFDSDIRNLFYFRSNDWVYVHYGRNAGHLLCGKNYSTQTPFWTYPSLHTRAYVKISIESELLLCEVQVTFDL